MTTIDDQKLRDDSMLSNFHISIGSYNSYSGDKIEPIIKETNDNELQHNLLSSNTEYNSNTNYNSNKDKNYTYPCYCNVIHKNIKFVICSLLVIILVIIVIII